MERKFNVGNVNVLDICVSTVEISLKWTSKRKCFLYGVKWWWFRCQSVKRTYWKRRHVLCHHHGHGWSRNKSGCNILVLNIEFEEKKESFYYEMTKKLVKELQDHQTTDTNLNEMIVVLEKKEGKILHSLSKTTSSF